MSDFPKDWWIPQDQDEAWQQEQLDLFNTKPISSKDEFKQMIIDVMNTAYDNKLGRSDPPF